MKARLGFVVFLVACGSPSPVPDGGADAAVDAGTDGGAQQTDAGSTPMTCSGFVTDAGEIAQLFVATATPVGTGGTIVDGTYDLTGWSVYTGNGGATGATGQMVAGTKIFESDFYRYNQRTRDADGGSVLDTNGTFTTVDGGVLVAFQNCPSGLQPFTSYTTDGTTLVFYSVAPPWGLTFTRR